MLLDQLPSARTEAKSAPAFCRKKAERGRISLAEEVGDERRMTDLIHPAIVSVAAGVCGSRVIRNKERCWAEVVRHGVVRESKVCMELKGHKRMSSGYDSTNMRLTGDLDVDAECDRAILYSFGNRQLKEHEEDVNLTEVRSIFRRSEGLHAVTRASKKAVLTDKSLMDIELLSPNSRMYVREDTISIGSSEWTGGGLWM